MTEQKYHVFSGDELHRVTIKRNNGDHLAVLVGYSAPELAERVRTFVAAVGGCYADI